MKYMPFILYMQEKIKIIHSTPLTNQILLEPPPTSELLPDVLYKLIKLPFFLTPFLILRKKYSEYSFLSTRSNKFYSLRLFIPQKRSEENRCLSTSLNFLFFLAELAKLSGAILKIASVKLNKLLH